MKRGIFGRCLVLACAMLAACSGKARFDAQQQAGAEPPLPKPRHFLAPPIDVPTRVGWQDGDVPVAAPGLKVERIASGLKHPRQLLVLPNQDVLVVEASSPNAEPVTTPKQLIAQRIEARAGKGAAGGNRVILLRRPANGQGEWERHLFIDHLHSPFGIQLIADSLYVADTDSLLKFPYVTDATSITVPGVQLADLPDTVNHHWTKSLLASPDGRHLYVGVGSNSHVGENGLEVEYRRADVLEVDVFSGASRVYASGLRNPTGLQWQPESGRLWAIVNERDEIGADLVPDYLSSVKDGGFYGWPYSYYGQHLDARVHRQRPDLVAAALAPDYALGSHVAPLGLWFYTGSALPSPYRDGAFIAEHGSWDRSPLSGYEVVFVGFQHGRPVGKPRTVLSGFVSEDGKWLHGAPAGLAQDAAGGLLVADDVGNSVWRVTAAGP